MKLEELEKEWNEIQDDSHPLVDPLLDTAHFAWRYVPKLLTVAKAADKLMRPGTKKERIFNLLKALEDLEKKE